MIFIIIGFLIIVLGCTIYIRWVEFSKTMKEIEKDTYIDYVD